MSSQPPSEPVRGERSWLDTWVNITTWWMEPAARAGAQVLSYGPERILVEIVDGVVQRFGDGSIEFSAGERSGKANLDWLRLITRRGRHEAHLQLSDLEFDGFAFDHLSAVVDSVQIISGRHPRLTLDDIRVSGRSLLSVVVGWINDRTADWAITVEEAGTVVARHRVRDVTAEVELSVDHDRVEMELRAVRWRRHRVAVPPWLRLRRTIATLELPPGVTVVEARRHGPWFDFDLHVDSIGRTFELAQLRDAILRGGRIPIP
jgi:hypothetical protein